MQFVHLLVALTAIVASAVAPAACYDIDPVPQDLNCTLELAISNLENFLDSSVQARSTGGACALSNISVRREWGALTRSEREAYTNAVLCLQSKPARTPQSQVPGVRSRYDDFVAVHIQQTMRIHYTANFLSWHRYFTWAYETALREECGYTGTQPYWNWGLYASSPQTSPIFNGDAYSMSGSGTPVTHDGYELKLPPFDPIKLQPGIGGGCVTDGPFKNMTVNLGPVASVYLPPNGNGLGYNPRCLARDVNPWVNQKFANHSAIFDLLIRPKNIMDFQMQMQGVPGSGNIGVHGGGHYTISGDPGADIFVSPGDPVFFLHHAMIDRVWTIWQALDLPNRLMAIAGTGTFLNNPPSPETTLDDVVDLGVLAPPRKIRDLMSPFKGPFCYIYL